MKKLQQQVKPTNIVNTHISQSRPANFEEDQHLWELN